MAESVKVAVRVRPFNKREQDRSATNIIAMDGKYVLFPFFPLFLRQETDGTARMMLSLVHVLQFCPIPLLLTTLES